MKKIILLILSVFLILTGCSNSNSNFTKSLNGFLEYELPVGWKDMEYFSKPMEISIETMNASVLVEYIQDEPKNFIEFKEEAIKLEKVKSNFLEDYNFEKNRKKITSKIYEMNYELDDTLKNYRLIGTIEFDKNKDTFLGIDLIFSGINNEIEPDAYKDRIDEIFNVLDTIKFTNVKLDEKRNIILESECIELTLQPYWKRLNKIEENKFYKEKKTIFLTGYFDTFSKKETTPQEEFEKICLKFEEALAENDFKVYSEINTEELKDRIITSKVYEIDYGYGYFNVIEFKDSDLFVIANYNMVILEGKFEDMKEEFDKMTKSINLIENAEEKFEKYKSVQDAHNKINDFIENMETENVDN